MNKVLVYERAKARFIAGQRPALRIAPIRMADDPTHGYGVITEKIFDYLWLAGANVLSRYEMGWDIRLAVGTPQSWMIPKDGGIAEDLVVHTMFDADLIPQTWVDILNHVGLIWVPSKWCEQVFRFSGVVRPIIVAGYGVDDDKLRYRERGWLADEDPEMRYGYVPGEREGTYTFLTCAMTHGDRKNEQIVRAAFTELKLPDARLVVKLRESHVFDDMAVSKHDPHITFRVGKLGLDEWVSVINRSDCYVGISSGEGFSLVPLEAMATGATTILLNYSGITEFADCTTSRMVGVGGMVWAELYNRIFSVEARWAFPDFDALKAEMRWCYEHRAEAAALGKQAAANVAARFTWRAAMERAYALLLAQYQ